jgi:hypothetical protein
MARFLKDSDGEWVMRRAKSAQELAACVVESMGIDDLIAFAVDAMLDMSNDQFADTVQLYAPDLFDELMKMEK